MTTVQAGMAPGRGRRFYTVMAALIALLVAAGFGPTYASSLAPPGLPWWVHLHGAAMTAWIVLFAVQAWLVGRRNLKLHRNLGWAAGALAIAIVPLGFATTMMAARRGATPPFFTPALMMANDMVDVLVFAGLVAAAIAARRQGDWHKRLLLSATVILSFPALGRLVGAFHIGLGSILPISTVLLLLLALVGPTFDALARRAVHPAYVCGLGAILLAQPLHLIVAASPPMTALARALTA